MNQAYILEAKYHNIHSVTQLSLFVKVSVKLHHLPVWYNQNFLQLMSCLATSWILTELTGTSLSTRRPLWSWQYIKACCHGDE